MRKFFGPANAEEAARRIVNRILRSAFRLFRNPGFKKSAGFDTLSQTEHDRIFNELEVTGLAMCTLMTEMMAQITERRERSAFFGRVKDELPKRFKKFLKEIGIEQKHMEVWGKLIDLRLDEFYEKRIEFRDALPKPEEGNPWVPLCATACLFHIRRGESIPHDPLFPLIFRWAGELSLKAQKILWHHISRL
jgi:hypothetical protein